MRAPKPAKPWKLRNHQSGSKPDIDRLVRELERAILDRAKPLAHRRAHRLCQALWQAHIPGQVELFSMEGGPGVMGEVVLRPIGLGEYGWEAWIWLDRGATNQVMYRRYVDGDSGTNRWCSLTQFVDMVREHRIVEACWR